MAFLFPSSNSSIPKITGPPPPPHNSAPEQQQQPLPPESPPTVDAAAPPESRIQSLLSPRSQKQFILFAAGSTFLTLSVLSTRRAVARRHLSTRPSYYTPSNRPPPFPINGAFEAVEALSLATVNLAGFAMMMVGGIGWAADISGVEELRRKVRGGRGVDGSGRSERDVEEEFEEWVAGVLDRKERKEAGRRGRVDGRGEGEVVRNERGKER